MITWLPCFYFVCIWGWLSQRYQTWWCKNSQRYWIPHQPRKYHFAEWSFGSKGERQSFKVVWFDTWWWLSYQEVSDSVINFYCFQASNRNMMMKGLYGRWEEVLSLNGLLIGKMLVQALEKWNFKISHRSCASHCKTTTQCWRNAFTCAQ